MNTAAAILARRLLARRGAHQSSTPSRGGESRGDEHRTVVPPEEEEEEIMEKTIAIMMQPDDLISAARTHGGVHPDAKVAGIKSWDDADGRPVVLVQFEAEPAHPYPVGGAPMPEEAEERAPQASADASLPARYIDLDGVPKLEELDGRALLGSANKAIMSDRLKYSVISALARLSKAIKADEIRPVEMSHRLHLLQYDGELYPSGEVSTYLRCIGNPRDLSAYETPPEK